MLFRFRYEKRKKVREKKKRLVVGRPLNVVTGKVPWSSKMYISPGSGNNRISRHEGVDSIAHRWHVRFTQRGDKRKGKLGIACSPLSPRCFLGGFWRHAKRVKPAADVSWPPSTILLDYSRLPCCLEYNPLLNALSSHIARASTHPRVNNKPAESSLFPFLLP